MKFNPEHIKLSIKLRRTPEMKTPRQPSQEQILQILEQNPPPAPDPHKRDAFIRQLTEEALFMDYMGHQTLAEKISSQLSYMSPWFFPLQAGILIILFCFSFAHALQAVTFCLMSLTPILTGLLINEISKSFGHNMWEMEAACRYNLTKLFFLRICIISAADFIVLTAALAAFRMAGGMLWQFACCTLLPFFLVSALCLWLLQHFGNLLHQLVLLTACALAALAELMIALLPEQTYENLDNITLDTIFLGASLGAMALFLLCALRLCTRKYFVYTTQPTLHV